MSGYYSGWRARHYNRIWRIFTERTLANTLTVIDREVACQAPTRLVRRVLDVGCGTGALLKQLAERFPEAELYGVDASADMLTQARLVLNAYPSLQLIQAEACPGETAGLPYAPGTFDLITCTNVFHTLAQPVEVLAGFGRLLAPGGHLVVEDYAQREHMPAFTIVEWLATRIEEAHVRAYTLPEARSLCLQAGFHVMGTQSFVVNWLWHGWVLHLV